MPAFLREGLVRLSPLPSGSDGDWSRNRSGQPGRLSGRQGGLGREPIWPCPVIFGWLVGWVGTGLVNSATFGRQGWSGRAPLSPSSGLPVVGVSSGVGVRVPSGSSGTSSGGNAPLLLVFEVQTSEIRLGCPDVLSVLMMRVLLFGAGWGVEPFDILSFGRAPGGLSGLPAVSAGCTGTFATALFGLVP